MLHARLILSVGLGLLLAPPLWAAEPVVVPELIAAAGCRGCHQLSGYGGTVGPALDGVGRRLGRERIAQWMRDPRQLAPKATMPAYDYLSPEEINRIVDFLTAPR